MRIHRSISSLIGRTPLLEPTNYNKMHSPAARLLCKLEYLNPTGSVKDRAALSIIENAEATGTLQPGGTIIEPTSGNTGIGLAALAAARGYRAILVMPDTMSHERRNLLKAYGAEVVLTPGADGMKGSIAKAQELQKSIPGAIIAGQFDNPANSAAHYATTGPEIWADTGGKVDILVAGVGTGGTLSGTAKYLKEQNPAIHIVAVEPAASPLLSGGTAGPHAIQGIGANFIPPVLERSYIGEVITVDNEAPIRTAKELGMTDGVLVGISSGAALWAATQVAARPENAGKTIVAILPDSADRYYSTPLFG
ncbi:MAG: cysteine synthase A [Akkermansiaceae bacterium]|nr:cysteine synthase A [Akkermansiaceae bacterium]